jgi:hypothetical protein
MMADQVPAAVWEGSFRVFGVQVRCYVLDDGRRIINAGDIDRLFDPAGQPVTPDPGELEEMTKWARGMS